MKPTPRYLLLICLTVLAPSMSCLAQQAREDRTAAARIDQFVNEQMLANQIPGVSLAVLREGKTFC